MDGKNGISVEEYAEKVANAVAAELAMYSPSQVDRGLAGAWKIMVRRTQEEAGCSEDEAEAITLRLVTRVLERVEQARILHESTPVGSA